MRALGVVLVVLGLAGVGLAFTPAVIERPDAGLLVGGGICVAGVGVFLLRNPRLRMEWRRAHRR